MQRSVALLCLALAFWLGSAAAQTPAVHASTTMETSIVDRYVRQHMFEDDVYEPIESLYREAMDDVVKGSHPKALAEITSSVLGRQGVKASREEVRGTDLGAKLLWLVSFMQRKFGMSETTAMLIFATVVVVSTPMAFLIAGMMIGSQNKRSMNRLMKKRYGDTYSVDATVKVEEDIDLDEDEDEDDDDEEEDDDDDDDDDDDA